MAKTQSLYPGAIDTTFQVDRQTGDIYMPDWLDRIEDALFEIETKLGITGGISLFDGAVTINNSEADKDFRVAAVGATNALFIQGSDGKIGIGTAVIPHGGIGYAMLALDGANASANSPIVQFTTITDNYPLIQIRPYGHDNIAIHWDSYFDGIEKSSDAGSNYCFLKYNDLFKIRYDSGIAQGAIVTWNDGITLGTTGIVGIPGKLGIGTTTVPHGGVGHALLQLYGAEGSSAGPHIQSTTDEDDYPLLQVWSWRHDTVGLFFDSYYDGANKSSDAGSNFQILKSADALKIRYDSGIAQGEAISWNEGIVLDTSGKVFINETINTKATGPSLTISQGGFDTEIFALKSSDVAHGVTDRTETDTFGVFKKLEGAAGGLGIYGYKDADGVNAYALQCFGVLGEAADDTKSAAGRAIVEVVGTIKAGTDHGTPAANANLFGIHDYTGTRFLFDVEGEMHSDAVIGVGDDWDEWDDLALASDLSRLPGAKFNKMMKYKAQDFEKAGLLTLSVDDEGIQHAFLRNKALHQFAMCCFSDIHDRFITVDERLNTYERAFEKISQKLGIPKMELLALGS